MRVRLVPGLKLKFTLDQVKTYLSQPGCVQWVKARDLLDKLNDACVDGRETGHVIATPGGDMASLTEAIIALGKLLDRHLRPMEITKLFLWRINRVGSFYMHTDEHALERLGRALNLGSAEAALRYVRRPPVRQQLSLLDYLLDSEFIGCGHLSLMLKNPEAYGMSRKVIRQLIKAFFNTLWNGTPADQKKINYRVLEGDHHEGAVVSIFVPGEVTETSWLPMVRPNFGGKSLFVFHPQVAHFMHEQEALALVKSDFFPEIKHAYREYHQKMIEVLGEGLRETISRLAFSLPQYSFELHR